MYLSLAANRFSIQCVTNTKPDIKLVNKTFYCYIVTNIGSNIFEPTKNKFSSMIKQQFSLWATLCLWFGCVIFLKSKIISSEIVIEIIVPISIKKSLNIWEHVQDQVRSISDANNWIYEYVNECWEKLISLVPHSIIGFKLH